MKWSTLNKISMYFIFRRSKTRIINFRPRLSGDAGTLAIMNSFRVQAWSILRPRTENDFAASIISFMDSTNTRNTCMHRLHDVIPLGVFNRTRKQLTRGFIPDISNLFGTIECLIDQLYANPLARWLIMSLERN